MKVILTKSQILKKYEISSTTFQRWTNEMQLQTSFCEGYIAVTAQTVFINEEIWQEFLIWKSKNKFKQERISNEQDN